jgi:hypothetical protein
MSEQLERLLEALYANLPAHVSADDINQELAEGLVSDIIQEMRRQRLFEEDNPGLEAFYLNYFTARLFAEIPTELNASTPQELIDASDYEFTSADIDILEGLRRYWEDVLRVFSGFLRTQDRNEAVIRAAIAAGDIPPDLFDKDPDRRAPFAEDAAAFIDQIENKYVPDFIERAVGLGVTGINTDANLRGLFGRIEKGTEANPVAPEARTFPPFEQFQATLLPERPEQDIVPNTAGILGKNPSEGKFKNAYAAILAAQQGIRVSDLDKDVFQQDASDAFAIFHAEMFTSGDYDQAVLKALNSLLRSRVNVQQRSDAAELRDEIDTALDKFNTSEAARARVNEFLGALAARGIEIPKELKEGISNFLAQELWNYAKAFPVEGGQLPQDPNTFLTRLIPQIKEAISGIAAPDVSEFGQPAADFATALDIVDIYLDDRGITLPPEMAHLRDRLARMLRDKVATLRGDERVTFNAFEFLDTEGESLKLRATAARLAGIRETESERKAFSDDDLDLFLFSHGINATDRDRFDILNRIQEIGIEAAQDEILADPGRYELAFEQEQIKTSPVFGVRRALLRQGVFSEDSDPGFMAAIEQTILEIASNVQDALIRDVNTDVDAFLESEITRIRAESPERIDENAFLRRQAQRTIGPAGAPGIVPVLGGGFERAPRAPDIDPTVFRPFIREQFGEAGTPEFLSFLFQQEPELLQKFQATQVPSIDEGLFDERFQMLKKPQRTRRGQLLFALEEARRTRNPALIRAAEKALADAGVGDVLDERDIGLTLSEQPPATTPGFTGDALVQLATAGAKVTPPTAGAFFTSMLPGLQEQFAESPGGIAEARRREPGAESARLLAQRERETIFQRSLRRGGHTIFSRMRT